MRFDLILHLAVAILLLTTIGSAQAGAPPLRVALVDFTSDDGFLRSAAASADVSGSVQAELADEPGIVWVERSQLQLAAREQELSAGGFTSGSSALRLGKLVHADLAIIGCFLRNERNDEGHTFRLEVVDLQHADTLAIRSFHVDGDRRDPIKASPELIRSAVTSTQEALTEARQRFAQGAHQKTVGLLYFRNADASPRLDRYGDGLNAAFAADAARGTDKLRVLQFPRAFDALGEAELTVLGLSEGDPDAWRQLADFYVWGSYQEQPSKDLPFEEVTVEATLFLWDGTGVPRQIVKTAKVADLPELTRHLSDEVCRLVLDSPGTPPTAKANANDAVTAGLLARATELDASLAAYGRRGSRERAAFAATPQGQAIVRQQSRLSETACFFSPLNRQAQLARLTLRWHAFPSTIDRLPFLRQWQRADELDAFAQSFPFGRDGGYDWRLRQATVDAAARLLKELSYGESWLDDLNAPRLLPIDTTVAEIAEWRARLETRFVRSVTCFVQETSEKKNQPDMKTYGCGVWIDTAATLLTDKKAAADLIEKTWPLYRNEYQTTLANTPPGSKNVVTTTLENLRKLFAALGQPERAERLLQAEEIPTPAPHGPKEIIDTEMGNIGGHGPAPPEFYPALSPSLSAHPPLTPTIPSLRPGWRTISLPGLDPHDMTVFRPVARVDGHAVRLKEVPEETSCSTVCAMTTDKNDTLWISVERRVSLSSRPSATFSILQVIPATDHVEDMTAKLGLAPQVPVTSLLAADGALWLTPKLGGVWQVDPDDAAVIRKHTLDDGLLDLSLDAAAASSDGHLYFSGSHEGQPLVNVYLPATRTWSRVDLQSGSLPARQATAQLQAGAVGHWMLAGPGPWVLHDLEKGRSEDLTARLTAAGLPLSFGPAPIRSPPFARQATEFPSPIQRRTCLADEKGFWLVAGARLAFLDPASGRVQSWPAMAATISALASDGENLWVVCPSQESSADGADHSDVAILHKPTGTWRGIFRVNGYVTCATVSRRAVYLGLKDAEEPLIEVSKPFLPSGS